MILLRKTYWIGAKQVTEYTETRQQGQFIQNEITLTIPRLVGGMFNATYI